MSAGLGAGDATDDAGAEWSTTAEGKAVPVQAATTATTASNVP